MTFWFVFSSWKKREIFQAIFLLVRKQTSPLPVPCVTLPESHKGGTGPGRRFSIVQSNGIRNGGRRTEEDVEQEENKLNLEMFGKRS